jgi:transposase
LPSRNCFDLLVNEEGRLSDHKFKVGQTVSPTDGYFGRANMTDIYKITQLLPPQGEHSVLRRARQNPENYPWLTQLLARRPFKVVAIALANKMARIAWALLASGARVFYSWLTKKCSALG